MIVNKDDIIFEAIEKDLDNPGIIELREFWSQKVNPNLSKFFQNNKNILSYIDEIDKRIQKIEAKYQRKDEIDSKRKKMLAMHNEGKNKTGYKKQAGVTSNSQLLFNTPLVNDAFQKVIKEDNDDNKDGKEILKNSLNNAAFVYKTEELDKNVIPVERYKKTIIGYMDLDLLLQRIAMETLIFHDEEINNFLLEGLCLQHTNFISSDALISKIISCFNFNYNRYLKSKNQDEDDETSREDNYSLSLSNYKYRKHQKIFISSKNLGDLNKTIEVFKDTENRVPCGLINLIIIFIKTYQKFSIELDFELAKKILDLLNYATDINEIEELYEKDMINAKNIIREMLKNSAVPRRSQRKYPIEKIYNLKEKQNNESYFDISTFSPKDIAIELTRVSYLLFLNIKPKEFFKGLFTKKDKEKTSPNICCLVNRFNNISFWVIEEVLSFDYSSDRARIIEKFINIANELIDLNNFNDCMSITSGLGQMILTKLSKSWKKVSSKEMNLLHKIKKLLNFQDNYKNIREEICKCIKEEKPFVPFLGYYTKRICFIEESGKYIKENSDLINVDKIAQVEQILSEFYDLNKVKYNFEVKDEIKNKLCILQCLDPLTEEELENEGNLIEPNFILGKKTKKKRITNTEKKIEENNKKKDII